MIRRISTIGAMLIAGLPVISMASEHDNGIERLSSQDGIEEVDQRLREALDDRGLMLVQVIDHTANAESRGLELAPIRTFIFGNPEVGTPMMQCQGSVALDLPQKMVLREADGITHLEWNSLHYLAQRHGLEECDLPLDDVANVLDALAQDAAGQ